jgi:hypothetical protein
MYDNIKRKSYGIGSPQTTLKLNIQTKKCHAFDGMKFCWQEIMYIMHMSAKSKNDFKKYCFQD